MVTKYTKIGHEKKTYSNSNARDDGGEHCKQNSRI